MSKEYILGIIGRGSAVEHSNGSLTFQEKDLKFIENLSQYFKKIVYSPMYYNKEKTNYEMTKSLYKARLKSNNVEIFKLFIKDGVGRFSNIKKRFYQLLSVKKINEFLNKTDFVLIFWPSPISFLTVLLCKFKRKKYAIYKGGSWTVENPIYGEIRRKSFKTFFGKIIEKMILKSTGIVFVRGFTEGRKNYFYIRGNSKFSIDDLYLKEDIKIKNKIILINVSPLNPLKGVDIIINAVKLLTDKGLNVEFYHIGAYYENNLREMKELIKKMDLEERVKFFGYIHDKEKLKKIMREADMFVLASYMEGFPRVIVEAMSQSLPVITTPVGGIPGLLRDGEEVLYFKKGDWKELAQKIEILINDEKLRRKLIKKGFNFAKKEFTYTRAPEMISEMILKNLTEEDK